MSDQRCHHGIRFPHECKDCLNEQSEAASQVWIVFKWADLPEFQGVFSSEEKAIDACRTANHVICPAIMDQELPKDPEVWPGAWYPRLQEKPR